MALKKPAPLPGSIIELETDPALQTQYHVAARSLWLDTSQAPAVLRERNAANTAWIAITSTPFYGMQTDEFTATQDQTSFTLTHTVLGGITSITTFFSAAANPSYVLQEQGVCTQLAGKALTTISGLTAGDKVIFVYPRAD